MGKIADKVAKAKNKAKVKVAAKVGGKKKVCAALALTAGIALIVGCATSGEQPARSQTQHNEIRDCIIDRKSTRLNSSHDT